MLIQVRLRQRFVQLTFNPVGDLGQSLLRVLQKVRSALVCFERGVVFVLLI